MDTETENKALVQRGLKELGAEVLRLKRTLALLSVLALLAGGANVFGVSGRVGDLVDRGTVGWNMSGNAIAKALQAIPTMFVSDAEPVEDAVSREPDVCEAFRPISEEARRTFFRNLPYGRIIREKSRAHGVDPILVVAIIENESGFRRNAVSSRGARGLMQLTPETGQWMGAEDLHDPAENIEAGVRYLHYLAGRFNGDLAMQLAAYNAGEGAVLRYGGVPPYRETRRYVEKVVKSYEKVADQLETFGRAFDAQSGGSAISPAG